MQVINNKKNQQFEVRLDDHLALLQYRIRKDTMFFIHTKVPAPFAGKGIASLLAKEGLEYAKREGYYIALLCPFVRGYVKKHPEYLDLIDRESHGPQRFK